MIYNIFGSKSSKDRDIMVFLPEIPKLEDAKKISKEYNLVFNKIFNDNKLANTNFAVLKNGTIFQVFKGTVDEVNNSIFTTYHFHEQNHPLQITQLLQRDFHLKLLRSARIILSFYTKTEYRDIVKKALHGDLSKKLECLKQIDFSTSYDFNKNQNSLDIYKTVAFQIGQVLGLKENKEFYCKESICAEYPNLKPYLERKESSLVNLNNEMDEYIKLLEQEIPKMKNLVE